MTIFGFAFGSDIEHVPIAVVNEDQGPIAARFVDALDREALDVREYDDLDAAQRGLEDAKLRAIVHFDAGFSAAVAGRNATLDLRVDGSNAQYVAHVVRHLQLAMEELVSAGGARLPVTVETMYAYAEGARYVDFFVPGIMAFAAMAFTTLLTLLTFVSERTSGTLSRLLVTPVRGSEIVLGYALAFGLIASIQAVILITVALLVFDALLVGSVVLAFVVVILIAVDAMSLGILLSAAAKRESQAVQMFRSCSSRRSSSRASSSRSSRSRRGCGPSRGPSRRPTRSPPSATACCADGGSSTCGGSSRRSSDSARCSSPSRR